MRNRINQTRWRNNTDKKYIKGKVVRSNKIYEARIPLGGLKSDKINV